MAANPDQSRRTQEEALAAALLLGRRYDLPALLRANRIRPRPFRRITPTDALRYAMARPYLAVIASWQAQRADLLAAYAEAVRTGDTAIITRAIAAAETSIDPVVAAQAREMQQAIAQIERWHRAQWVARIKAATTLNVSALTLPADVEQEAGSAVAWNDQLLTDVHRQASAGIAAVLFAGAAIGATALALGPGVGNVVEKGRKRSLGIGVDQVDRIVQEFSRARRRAAGLDRFIWHHSPHVITPRPEHLARDGKTFTEANAPNDRAGTLYGCQCWEQPIWE